MKDIKRHSPGTFSWIELGTSDTSGAKKFYQSLFGWTAMDIPMGPDFTYTILQLEGQDVGALYKIDAGSGEPGCSTKLALLR